VFWSHALLHLLPFVASVIGNGGTWYLVQVLIGAVKIVLFTPAFGTDGRLFANTSRKQNKNCNTCTNMQQLLSIINVLSSHLFSYPLNDFFSNDYVPCSGSNKYYYNINTCTAMLVYIVLLDFIFMLCETHDTDK